MTQELAQEIAVTLRKAGRHVGNEWVSKEIDRLLAGGEVRKGVSTEIFDKLVERGEIHVDSAPPTAKRERKPKGERKVANFDQVNGGKCPHCGSALGDDVAGRGEGVKRTCIDCGHVWYLNRKVRTCKCLTCGKQEVALESSLAH